ncbi:MAG: protein kinase [Anaerolineae bacterium]
MTFTSQWTGKQVGDFVIEEPIGRGGMAMVYSARQCSVDRQVALKIIELHPDGDGEFLKRFTHEAEVIAMLEHIHILPIFGYGLLEGEIAYFAMRLLRNGTLADRLRKGALPLDEAVDLFTQIASGLDYIHSRGVVHRDLKPSNILLDENGNAYLSDFGLAQLVDVTISLNAMSLRIAGSPTYLAPEVIQGEPATPLSDIYSLGVMLYHMLCGRPPFESKEGKISSLLYQHIHSKPTAPRQLNPEIPPAVEAIVLRALSKNPQDRFASPNEMALALRDAAQNHPSSGVRLAQIAMRPVRRVIRHRRRWQYLAVLVAAIIVIGAAVLIASQNRTPPPMNVTSGARAALADVPLTDGEIALARSRLEPEGFVAYIPCTLTDGFQAAVSQNLTNLAEQINLPLRLYDSEGDPAREMALVEQARVEGARAFILCPLGEPLLDDTISSLQDASIPLVLAQRYGSTYGVKVELDDDALGREQGSFAGQILQAKDDGHGVVVLLTALNTSGGKARASGMVDGLRQTASQAQALDPLDGATREQARQVITNLIADGTGFNAIVTISDDAALGAVDALQAANLTPDDVFIVSANDSDAVSSYIRDGYYLRGSVAIDPNENAQLLLNGIVKALAGSPVAEFLTVRSGALVTSDAS